MRLHTASEGITLAKKLENDSAKYYEEEAERLPEVTELFHAFAKENKRNVTYIERTYYGVITDAIEASYCFDLDPSGYLLDLQFPDSEDIRVTLIEKSLEIEKLIITFYTEAAEQSESLMADIPRAFVLIAKKRRRRVCQLEGLLAELQSCTYELNSRC